MAEPAFVGNEEQYVLDCLRSTWISSSGRYLGEFEAAFADYCGAKHAITCCNGTAALHLALLGLGIGPGDEVILPTFTYVATANAIRYCGAQPVFVDSEPDTWNLDTAQLADRITSRTRAILAVHIYGHPANLEDVLQVAKRNGLAVVEDAAEAHGALERGRRVGALGDVGTFSFYGNKILTTGEGGMVVTNDDQTAALIRQLRGQGMDTDRRYWFPMMGYNYRMTNLAAAIGLAQLECIDWHLARRQEVAAWYGECLADAPRLVRQKELSWARSSHWMTSVLIEGATSATRDRTMQRLSAAGIETRPLFVPMHRLPMYEDFVRNCEFPVADALSDSGLNLPTSAILTRGEVEYVCEQLVAALDP